ncbi:helix-turn-helix transcriptional regulator [Alsobacter metallidurans]|uniref:helix-turn-helix transcriptional regulator n=1 Tax=Alsobacter metallidurans TaxID=340221 RepID=UPI00166C43DB
MDRNTERAADRLLNESEVAQLLGVSRSWLAKSRLIGSGPRFIKLGRSVRYHASAIADYVRSRSRTSTSQLY